MSVAGGAICSGCSIVRPIGMLIAVRDRASGRVRFCCRPSEVMPTGGRSSCFTTVVRTRAIDEICLATDLPREKDEPRAGRRGAFDVGSYQPTAWGMAAAAS